MKCDNLMIAATELGKLKFADGYRLYKKDKDNFFIDRNQPPGCRPLEFASLVTVLEHPAFSDVLPRISLSKLGLESRVTAKIDFTMDKCGKIYGNYMFQNDLGWDFARGLVRARDADSSIVKSQWWPAFSSGFWSMGFDTPHNRANKAILKLLKGWVERKSLFSSLLRGINKKLSSELKYVAPENENYRFFEVVSEKSDKEVKGIFVAWIAEFDPETEGGVDPKYFNNREIFNREQPRLTEALELRKTVNGWKAAFEPKYNAFIQKHGLNETDLPEALKSAQQLGRNVRNIGLISILGLLLAAGAWKFLKHTQRIG